MEQEGSVKTKECYELTTTLHSQFLGAGQGRQRNEGVKLSEEGQVRGGDVFSFVFFTILLYFD